MRVAIIWGALVFWLLFEACSSNSQYPNNNADQYFGKDLFNSEWQKQGVGPDEWYYRLTVIDAPANTQALNLADGHWLHPEVIRFEITKDLLIGFRAHASVLNADHEMKPSMKRNYRGAPVVAYGITDHFDLPQRRASLSEKITSKPWFLRKYITVDWSKNLVSRLTRGDSNEGLVSSTINNKTTYVVDQSSLENPKRSRVGKDFFEFTTRHPVPVSEAAYRGAYGLTFREDSAAAVVDIRHFFLKKKSSDFIPLPYPDEAWELDEKGHPVLDQSGNPNHIAINKRFGLLRTSLDGRPSYDEKTGTLAGKIVVNATIFNIWKKSKNGDNSVIPIEEREVQPIIYYTNVLHPENLMEASFSVSKLWDDAFREAVFHAQPGKYATIDAVPSLWILRKNNCSIENVLDWLRSYPELKDQAESAAQISLINVQNGLKRALDDHSQLDFSHRQALETKAKRELEQFCSALEFYSETLEKPFVYQRAGDLRFNLLNLEVENNTTQWSGYGPMFADPITGEILSANAHINLKYIDLRSQQIAKHIDLLNEKLSALKAVFGNGAVSQASSNDHIDVTPLRAMRANINSAHEATKHQSPDIFDHRKMRGITDEERHALRTAHLIVDRATTTSPVSEEDYDKEDTPSSKPTARSAIMDPVRFVDNISIGIALKYAHLPEHDRFLKIREAIYKSVALHEIGHNVGLRHNMAGSSDALNYGKDYWQIEQLPSNIATALSVVSDVDMSTRLKECLEKEKSLHEAVFNKEKNQIDNITTQDCLLQKNGMYASIMDYHASSLAGIKGLGLYDRAAIKWAYTQTIEVFPKENIVINVDNTDLDRWLRLNDFHHIPTTMLKNAAAINYRQHKKFSWDDTFTHGAFPKNAVPYVYCDDPTGFYGPRCLAYDFGPDMQSSARWLKDRYWQQFLLTHFAKDDAWLADSRLPLVTDIDILNRFTNILRWYYRFIKEDKEFAGSYAEQDYLKAIAMGINHFAHVIGSPESGTHISAPIWTIEDRQAIPTSIDRLSAANFLIPLNHLPDCSARSILTTDAHGRVNGRFGYQYLEVPLGIGRPLLSGYSGDIEDKFILYHGSLLAKKYALYLLMAPLSTVKTTQTIEKNDLLSMTWYRMFPEAVGKIYSSVIGKHYELLGPVIDQDGSIYARDVIDEKTLKVIDQRNSMAVMPAMDDGLAVFAAENALSFIPNTIDQESNLLKSMKISCRGCSDDIDYAEIGDNETSVVHYVHLSGQEYKAQTIPHMPSIGADLLLAADRQKARYLRISQCIENENSRVHDPFCQCVKTIDRKTFDRWMCCDENNQDCSGPELEPVDGGLCTIEDLKRRKNQSMDQLDSMVGFIDNLRKIMK